MLGTRQSGLAAFRLARIESDGDLLEAARDDAQLIVARDPGLASPRGQALRVLLYLFEREGRDPADRAPAEATVSGATVQEHVNATGSHAGRNAGLEQGLSPIVSGWKNFSYQSLEADPRPASR